MRRSTLHSTLAATIALAMALVACGGSDVGSGGTLDVTRGRCHDDRAAVRRRHHDYDARWRVEHHHDRSGGTDDRAAHRGDRGLRRPLLRRRRHLRRHGHPRGGDSFDRRQRHPLAHRRSHCRRGGVGPVQRSPLGHAAARARHRRRASHHRPVPRVRGGRRQLLDDQPAGPGGLHPDSVRVDRPRRLPARRRAGPGVLQRRHLPRPSPRRERRLLLGAAHRTGWWCP